jgi:hypothetical protein
MGRRLRALVVCTALIAMAGCAPGEVSSGTGKAQAGADAAQVAAEPAGLGMSCDAEWGVPERAGEPSRRPLPAGFVPVSAGRCVFTVETVPGDGEWQVRLEQRATGSLDALTRALRQPSREQAGGVACPAIGYLPIVITLADAAGRTVTPEVPHEVCGAPSAAVVSAITALSWQTVTRTKVHRVRSQMEIDTGCSGAYKPMIAIEGAEAARRSPATGLVFQGTRPPALQVCRFRLDPTEKMDVNGGPPLAMGRLRTAGRLTGAALTRFLDALDAAPGAGPCGEPQAPFAVLFPVDGKGTSVSVELGGCYRFDDGNANLRQLDPATVALLGA